MITVRRSKKRSVLATQQEDEENDCNQKKPKKKKKKMMSGRLQQPVLLQQQKHQHQLQQQATQQQRAAGDVPGYYGCPGLIDQRDIVWPKLQMLKTKYMHDLEQLYKLITSFDSRTLNADHVLKLNHYKEVVYRALNYLKVSRERLPLEFTQDILEGFGKQIVMIIETFKRKPDSGTSSTSAGPGDGKI